MTHPFPAARRTAWRRLATAAGLLATALPALAQLQARDAGNDGSVDAYYDPVRQITWLAHAQAAAGSTQDDGMSTTDGLLTWQAAQSWAAALTIGGVGGWRLPGIDAACNGNGVGYGCSSGELGHHFYNNLGGSAGMPLSMAANAQAGLFQGLADQTFWARDTLAQDPDQAGVLLFSEGYQDNAFKAFSEHAAWAVHDGDALAAVPEPANALTLLAGLGGLWLAWRRRRAARVSP